ncbi:helix-turn-helix domain-containing protein [Micromonospora sp. RP3T]|uniref:helix-turn-helix domain-containing protein n=1 Tax=Micromonospora sp. RP3T TaxID=2135446 RepID=UPI0018ECA995|nr:helix-turn-helix domain-containing protein [Micromonospora sp. RP3T]
MGGESLPIGRRVAYWRSRRRMSQQVFADRLGKSKSWVDKVERGARSLDKVSTIADVAAVLRIDRAVLLGAGTRVSDAPTRADGVERIRAALSTYEMDAGRREARPAGRLARDVGYAWTTYQHARYAKVADALPDLLVGAQRGHARVPEAGREPLVEAYRVTASLLLKLCVGDLAWLAADRAMTVAAGDPVLVAAAAVQLGQVLQATGRAGSAVPVMRAAAYRIGLDGDPSAHLALCGTLLVQAALAAARAGDERAVAARFAEAAELAERVGDEPDQYRTAFGAAAVVSARMLAAVELGDVGAAAAWHRRAVDSDGWRWLPVEHRAAHLVDAARGRLLADDPAGAGRLLVAADRIAPGEVRCRPVARDLLARVARSPDAPATVLPLAAVLSTPEA